MNVLRTDTPESLKIGKKTRVVRLAREDTRVVVVRAAVSRVEVVLPPLSPDRNRCICKTRVYREGKEKKKDRPSLDETRRVGKQPRDDDESESELERVGYRAMGRTLAAWKLARFYFRAACDRALKRWNQAFHAGNPCSRV